MVIVEENKPKEIIAYAHKRGMQAKVRFLFFSTLLRFCYIYMLYCHIYTMFFVNVMYYNIIKLLKSIGV